MPDDLLATVREALAAATPGPWRDVPMGSEGSVVLVGGNTARTSRRVARAGEYADAHLIANAPTWLAALVAEVEKHATTADAMTELFKAKHEEANALRARIEALRDEWREGAAVLNDDPTTWQAVANTLRHNADELDALLREGE